MQQNTSSIMTKDLLRITDEFKKASILVIGDVMLDKFIWGDVTRVSPEAPVPVVHVKQETYAPGGAANAAMNVATLGATCYLVGLVGDDAAKDVLTTLLTAKNVHTEGLFTHPRPTIQKIRIVGNNQHIVRFDYEEQGPNQREQDMLGYIKTIINTIDLILVSDYAKGVITKTLMTELKAFSKKIIVDPKPDHFHYYQDVYLIKPNQKETTEITGIKGNLEENLLAAGRALVEQSNAHVLVSRGKDGMTLFERDGTVTHLPTYAKEACDVTGAGDTVVATTTVALAGGASLKDAALLANYAAGIKVSRIGTVPISFSELQTRLQQ